MAKCRSHKRTRNRLQHAARPARHDKSRSCMLALNIMQRSSLSVQLRFCPSCSLHPFIEDSPRQRIGKRDADIVGPRAADEGDRSPATLPSSRRDIRIAESSRRGFPLVPSLSRALYTAESRNPLSIASRIFCDPDSTPIHTSAQPADLERRYTLPRSSGRRAIES